MSQKSDPEIFAWLDSVPTSNISRTIWSFVILCLQSWSLKLTVVSHHFFLRFSVWKWLQKNPHGYRHYKIEVLLKMSIFLGVSAKKMDKPCWTSTVAPRRRDETWRSLWIGVDLASDHSRSIDSIWFHGIPWDWMDPSIRWVTMFYEVYMS